MELLKASGFVSVQPPTPGVWRNGSSAFSVRFNASSMKRHGRARFVVEQHGQAKVDMQKANEPVEREVILGRYHDPCIVRAFRCVDGEVPWDGAP